MSPSFVAAARSTARSFSESLFARMSRSSPRTPASSVRRYVTISASVTSLMLVAVESMAAMTAVASTSSFESAARNPAT